MSTPGWHLSITVSLSLHIFRRRRARQLYSLSIIIRDISLSCYLWCARCHFCLQSPSALIDHSLDQYSANKWDNRPVMSAGQRLQTITVQLGNKIESVNTAKNNNNTSTRCLLSCESMTCLCLRHLNFSHSILP
jgi:hypothetical protein